MKTAIVRLIFEAIQPVNFYTLTCLMKTAIVRLIFEAIQPVNFYTLTCLMKTAVIDEFKRKQLENIDEKG